MTLRVNISEQKNSMDLSELDESEREFLESILHVLETRQPTLQQMQALIDFIWHNMNGNSWKPDPNMLARFYRHPVWTLNGFFIEQHSESIFNRETVSNWAKDQEPSRVADFGGGFGTLAIALRRISSFPRATYRNALQGLYDIVLATDVFEHTEDPLGIAAAVSKHIPIGGRFMTANDFRPTIACHLPATFHFRSTWHFFMLRLGYRVECPVGHGWSYLKVAEAELVSARKWEKLSRSSFRYRRKLPSLDRLLERLLIALARVRPVHRESLGITSSL
jgi:hypothetical protein